MNAVLRVWWTFFTAVPLQRALGIVGGCLFGVGVIGWLLTGNSASFGIGFLAFVVLAGFPALFSAPAIFRSLSAARMYQLLPRFRLRMLLAVSLLLGALLASTFVFVLAGALQDGRSLWAIGYPFAFLVAMFLLLFLAFGDWRWSVLLMLALLFFGVSVNEPAMLAVPPAWLWFATALGAWVIFAAWYLRVRQVRGIAPMPESRSGIDATRPVLRTVAIRVLLAPNTPRAADQIRLRNAPWLLATLVIMFLIAFSLTSFVAPLMLMVMSAQPSLIIVRQSRLLWLRIPGARDAVRSQVERALWRNLAMGCWVLVVAAAIAASPLMGHGAAEIALGFALAAGASIYAAYVALAAVRGISTYVWGLGSMALLQIGLLVLSVVFSEVFSPHSLTAPAVVAAVELAGAALLRALAVRRWRTVDWLRFKPLLVGVPRSL
jgi:hypothetical protein